MHCSMKPFTFNGPDIDAGIEIFSTIVLPVSPQTHTFNQSHIKKKKNKKKKKLGFSKPMQIALSKLEKTTTTRRPSNQVVNDATLF